jgi:23S rRNA (uracil1939-C5)-methyltransferase
MKTFSVGEIHPLTLTGLAVGGEAVGRVGDLAVFVPFGTPGDEIEVRLNQIKKNYARGEIERIINPSPHRIKPQCPIFYKCGGCQLQQMTYAAQLIYKRKMLEEIIHHLGNIRDIRVDDVLEAPNPWNYRNKMQVVATTKPFLHSEKESPYVGLYGKQSHQVIRMEDCMIQHPLANQLVKVVREAVAKLQWEIYDEHTHKGLLRHLVTRIGTALNEILLILVVTTDKVPNLPEFVHMVTRKIPQVKGISINVNDKKTNVIMGPNTKLVWGEDHLIEEIQKVKYHISSDSFFQINPVQTGRMFKIVEDYLELDERDIILDAYAGIGAISLWLANKVRTVIGIEEIPQSRKDALASSVLNDIGNFEFHKGMVERILPELYHKGYKIDKIVLDPPRKGCETSTLDIISKMRVKRLVYISCSPPTLARDLAYLKDQGYKVEQITPVDMFPQTYHIESVVKLSYQPAPFLRNVIKRVPETARQSGNQFDTNILDDKVLPDDSHDTTELDERPDSCIMYSDSPKSPDSILKDSQGKERPDFIMTGRTYPTAKRKMEKGETAGKGTKADTAELKPILNKPILHRNLERKEIVGKPISDKKTGELKPEKKTAEFKPEKKTSELRPEKKTGELKSDYLQIYEEKIEKSKKTKVNVKPDSADNEKNRKRLSSKQRSSKKKPKPKQK